MSLLRRLLLVACALTLVAAPVALADSGAPSASASKKGKKCKHGYKLKTVTKHGKKVKVCGKAKAKGKPKPAAPSPAPAPPAPSGPTGLFEAPGKKLEGGDALPFLQKYLANSTFTDCPARWPNCAVEYRYSHTPTSFYYCRLTSVSGADIINGARGYQVQNAVVEADGSWTFNEQVENEGGPSFYEWHVSASGVVTGAYQFAGNPVEQIGPLQYVGGARDCSY
jgi:hypothetical protein